MKNVIILGSGRSGTSLTAGLLAQADYFMGDDLLDAGPTNPKGFFEDRKINWLNERILFPHMQFWRRLPVLHNVRSSSPGPNQMWLARVPLDGRLNPSKRNLGEIKELTARAPFCFKDPRFSYTLPVWRPYLQNTVYLCVFRDPASMVTSALKSLATVGYLANLKLTADELSETWNLLYTHILERHCREGQWMFLHYKQFFELSTLERLGAFVEAPIAKSFPEKRLERSAPSAPVSGANAVLYKRLCEAAGYSPN